MYKPLLIKADPRIRVHGNYNAGAAHINRARALLHAHLLEDSAFNIQVSKKRYYLAPGVVCVATHEYAQTYLDIYTQEYPSARKHTSVKTAAYFGSYVTTHPLPGFSGRSLSSFATFAADGSLLTSEQLFFDSLQTGDWDYLGSGLVGCAAQRYIPSTTPDVFVMEAGVSFRLIDAYTGTIKKSVPLNVPGFMDFMYYLGGSLVLILMQVVDQQTNIYTNYVYDFINNTLTAGSSSTIVEPPGVGAGTPREGAGQLNATNNRVMGSILAQQSTQSIIIGISPDKNNQTTYVVIPPASAVGSNGIVPFVRLGFTLSNDYIAVLFNGVDMYPTSNIPAHFRVYWNGGAYDFTPDPVTIPYTADAAVRIKVIPYGDGAIISTEQYLVYFANGKFISYVLVGGFTNNEDGIVDYCNTARRGLFNLFVGVTAEIGVTAQANIPTNWPYTTPYWQGERWVPIAPGDWLDYPTLYG